MHLPYELLSDVDLEFATVLDLSALGWKDRKPHYEARAYR